jgi:hypothetical protein
MVGPAEIQLFYPWCSIVAGFFDRDGAPPLVDGAGGVGVDALDARAPPWASGRFFGVPNTLR